MNFRFGHDCVSILFIAVCVSLAKPAAGQHPAGVMHPPMPDQELFLHCRMELPDGPATLDTPLELASPLVEAKLSQKIELPAPWDPIRVLRYLPSATLEQEVIPDQGEHGRPAIELSIFGPKQSHKRWLIADDPERNRLVSYIGTWRYMAAADWAQRDELFEQFETEFTREPQLAVRRLGSDVSRELDLRIGAVQELNDLGCRVRVLDFYPHYSMNRETKTPVNRSERRRNPAVLVEIEHEGLTERRWVFSKFPGFAANHTNALPFDLGLDCPVETARPAPDFAVVTIGRSNSEVWTRREGKAGAQLLAVKEPVAIGDSKYRFEITTFVPAGRIVEHYLPAKSGGGAAALQIEVSSKSDRTLSLWLESGKRRNVRTRNGLMTVSFGPHESRPAAVHP